MPDANGNPTKGEPGYLEPNTGLIQSGVPGGQSATTYTPSTATAVQATSQGYSPEQYAVTDDQTVQGQLDKILDVNSPLMQQAAVRAKQQANQSGLLNSSIAVGAGQTAVMDRALPIAQQDAGAYERANTNTVNAQNAALQFGAASANDASKLNAQLGTGVNQENANQQNVAKREASGFLNDYQSKMALANLDANTRLAIANLDAQTKTTLETMNNQYRQLLQQNQGMTSMFNQVVASIAQISQNQTMSKQAKDAAITSQLNMLNEALQAGATIGGTLPTEVTDLDISQYFTTGTPANPNQPSGGTGTPGGLIQPSVESWQSPDGKAYSTLPQALASWVTSMKQQNGVQPGSLQDLALNWKLIAAEAFYTQFQSRLNTLGITGADQLLQYMS